MSASSSAASGFASFESLEPRRLLSGYVEQDLVSNGAHASAKTDARLTNPWGIAVSPHGIVVSDEASGMGTIYDGNGNNVLGTVHVPGGPTGVVYNGDATKFIISGKSQAAPYIFVTLSGTIDAWTGAKTDRTASVVVDRSAAGAVYTGAAIGTFKRNPMLYVANFAAGRVDAFDANFNGRSVPGRFADPNLPANYVPFNITNIEGQLYVTYAEHLQGQQKETTGAGLGLVDVFNTDGTLVRRFATGGKLNAPWGVALAPSNFDGFSGDILIGNFGDGHVTAFTPSTGTRKGQLADFAGNVFTLPGVWGIAFGNGKAGNLTTGLYFGAGISNETAGLYGRLIPDANYPSAHTSNATNAIATNGKDVLGSTAIGADPIDDILNF